MKKSLSGLLAGALVLGITTVASAAEPVELTNKHRDVLTNDQLDKISAGASQARDVIVPYQASNGVENADASSPYIGIGTSVDRTAGQDGFVDDVKGPGGDIGNTYRKGP